MIYAIFNDTGRVETAINDQTINQIPEGAFELSDDQFANRFDLLLEDGQLKVVPLIPNAPTQSELIIRAVKSVKTALQSTIDAKAHEFGFSDGNAFMLYAGFTNPFQSIALTFAEWEASVWVEAEAYKQQVLAGTAPMLSPEEAVAMMPVYPN